VFVGLNSDELKHAFEWRQGSAKIDLLNAYYVHVSAENVYMKTKKGGMHMYSLKT